MIKMKGVQLPVIKKSDIVNQKGHSGGKRGDQKQDLSFPYEDQRRYPRNDKPDDYIQCQSTCTNLAFKNNMPRLLFNIRIGLIGIQGKSALSVFKAESADFCKRRIFSISKIFYAARVPFIWNVPESVVATALMISPSAVPFAWYLN
ncbi:hypothetical protein [Caproiciproducens sp.]